MILARNSVIVTENIEKQRIEYYVSRSSTTPSVDGIGTVNPPYSLTDGDYVYEQTHYWHTDGTETYGEWMLSYLFSNVANVQNIVSQVVEKNSDGKWEIKEEVLNNTYVYEPLRDTNGNIVYDDDGNAVADQNKPISISKSLMETIKTADGISQVVSNNYSDLNGKIGANTTAIGLNTTKIQQNANYIGLIVDTTNGDSSIELKDGFIQAMSDNGIVFKNNLTDGVTEINGDNIITGSIKTSDYLYTDDESSSNYNSGFSKNGMCIDLDGNSIISQYFRVDNMGANILGKVEANSGSIGKVNPFTIDDNGLNGHSNYGNKKIERNKYKAEQIDLDSPSAIPSIELEYRILGGVITDENNMELLIKSVSISASYDLKVTKYIVDEDDETEEGNMRLIPSGEELFLNNSFSIPIESSFDATEDIVVTLDGNTKTYSYEYMNESIFQGQTADKFITSKIFSYYLPKFEAESVEIEISNLKAELVIHYDYILDNQILVTHIGTDYFDYSGMITVKNGKVFLSNVSVEGGLDVDGDISLIGDNSVISGSLGKTGTWSISSDKNTLSPSLNITLSENKPIRINQFFGTGINDFKTLTLIDTNGNTTLPGILNLSNIMSTTDNLFIRSGILNLYSQNVFVGDVNSSLNAKLRFKNNVGTYLHDCYLSGGDGRTDRGFTFYDATNRRDVIYYKDSANRLYINTDNFYFKDYMDTLRQPVSSISGDGNRAACIGTTTTGVRVYGQWGVEGDPMSYKTLIPSSSDIRLKDNVGDCEISRALDVVNSIKLHSFDWKHSSDNKHQKIGFIADELEKLDSKLSVGGDCDEYGNVGYKSVDTFYLLGYVVKAIQEISAENDRLRNIIENMK